MEIQLGSLRLEGRAAAAFVVVCGFSALYFLVDHLLPDILGRVPFLQPPAWIGVPTLLIGVASLTVAGALGALMLASFATESSTSPSPIELRPFEELTADGSELLAPNLSRSQRATVIDTAREQLASGSAARIHGAVEHGEHSAQILIVETVHPKLLRDIWAPLSDGAWVRHPRTLAKRFGLRTSMSAVEVVWD